MAAYWTGERKKQPPRRFLFPSHTTTGADAAQNAANPQNRGGGIIVKVQEAVWDEFRREDVEPEMIINRRGRAMFPVITLHVNGLEKYLKYSMTIDMLPADKHRYRYNQGLWEIRRGELSNEKFQTTYTHPNSPWTGTKWMERAIAFQELKLSNHLETAKSCNHIYVSSLRKYIPRLTIHVYGSPNCSATVASVTTLHSCHFIAVTSYRDTKAKRIKMNHNPYARGYEYSYHKQEEEMMQSRTNASQMYVPVGMSNPVTEVWPPPLHPHPAAGYLPIQHPMFPFANRPGEFPHKIHQQLAWQSQFVPAPTFQPAFPITTTTDPLTTQMMISTACGHMQSTSAPMSIQPTSENTTSSSTRLPLYVRRYLRARASQATCQVAVHNEQPTMSIQISGTSAANNTRPTCPQSIQATCSTGCTTELAANTQPCDHISHLQAAFIAPPGNRTLPTHPHAEWGAYGYHYCKCEASQMTPLYFYSRPLAASAIVPPTPISDNHEGAAIKPPSPENEREGL